MGQENKFYLPYVLDGIMTKLSALFLQKLVLFDSEILEAKHMRHYDHQCEGLVSLVHFFERKINKNAVFAFQMIKNPDSVFSDDGQLIQLEQLKQDGKKVSSKTLDDTITPRTKFVTRLNTTFEQSDNSLIFSPNINKHRKATSRTQFIGSTVSEKSEILQKLLNRVRKVNTEASQQCLYPAKSSYFNLTLGKQSIQTFHNQCQCQCHNETCIKSSKMMKRKRILEKFQRIERKIYEQPPIYVARYVTPKATVNRVKKYRAPNTTYSVYEPTIYEENPQQIIYVASKPRMQTHYRNPSSGLSTSKSMAHITYANQVYI